MTMRRNAKGADREHRLAWWPERNCEVNSVGDLLLIAVLSLLAFASIGLRGRVLGRRRTLVAAERLLRAERPGIDRGWSMGEWDWAIKKVLADTASEQEVMADDRQRYDGQATHTRC